MGIFVLVLIVFVMVLSTFATKKPEVSDTCSTFSHPITSDNKTVSNGTSLDADNHAADDKTSEIHTTTIYTKTKTTNRSSAPSSTNIQTSQGDRKMPILTLNERTDSKSQSLFNDPEGTYNYCPSFLELDNGDCYIYYCSNKEYKDIRDHIIVRKGRKTNGMIQWGERKIILAPTPFEWDSMHACDPDVIAGSFRYDGTSYNYIMAYLGCVTDDCTVNEVGIAFAKSPEGPWIKYSGNPVVDYDENEFGKLWGVGQAALVSLDQKGKVLLFYTRGDKYGTRTVVRACDFEDMSKPVIGKEIVVSTAGLTEIDGSTPVLNNADFLLDTANRRMYLIRDRHPNGSETPDFISSQLQIAYCDTDENSLPVGNWTVFANISKEHTGYVKNHNACLAANRFGHIPSDGRIEAYFAISEIENDYLWSYKLHNVLVGKI